MVDVVEGLAHVQEHCRSEHLLVNCSRNRVSFCCCFGSLLTYHLIANKNSIDCVQPFHKLLIKAVKGKLACYYSPVHGFQFKGEVLLRLISKWWEICMFH